MAEKKKNGTIEKSPRKGKKLRIWQDGKAFDFGDSSMQDYRQHKDDTRKKAWYARHKKNLEGNSPRAKAFRLYAKKTWELGGEYQGVTDLPKYQHGSTIGNNLQSRDVVSNSQITGELYPTNQIQGFQPASSNNFLMPGIPDKSIKPVNELIPGYTPSTTEPELGANTSSNTRKQIESALNPKSKGFTQDWVDSLTPSGTLAPTGGTNNKQDSDTEKEQNQRKEINPYAGVDIPTAANFLGKSIVSGNPLGIVAGGLKTGLGVARNMMSGMGREKVRQDTLEEMEERQRENRERVTTYSAEDGGYYMNGGIQPVNLFKNGGQLKEEEVLTGEKMQGASSNNQTVQKNAEVEDNEYIHSQDGSSIKVEGKKHEQGGEEVELKEGDRIISDNLKLKGDGAKEIKNQFDVKVKAKDTYAKAVDKIYNKIGLTKLINEEEKIIKKISEIEEKTKDETTQNLNYELLTKKLQEIQKQKQELEPQRQKALNTVFEMQEASKPKKDKEQESFEDGGIKQMADQYGIPYDRAKQLIEEYKNGGYKEYEDGGKFNFNVNDTSYEVDITDDDDAKKAEEYINQINKIRKENPNAKKVSDLPKEYAEAVKNLEGIVKEYDETANIQSSLAGNKEGRDTIIDNQFFGKKNKTAEYSIKFDEETQPTETEEDNNQPTDKETTQEGDYNYSLPLTPDQGVLPPSAMASQLDVTRRFDRVDPNLLSAEQAIAENSRNAQAVVDAGQDLSDVQRAAMLSQISANTQNKNNEIISQVENQNAQIKNQTDAQNAQTQMAEENARAQDALSFEKRQQTAEAITEENVKQFYDYLRRLNASNFNDVRRRNTVNQMTENFNIDSQGNVENVGESPNKEQLENYFRVAKYLKSMQPAPQTKTKKS